MHLNSEPSCSHNVRVFSTLECDQHSFPQLYSLRLAMVLFSRVFLSAAVAAASGYVPRGQRALLDTDMHVLIDRSTCLVEPVVGRVIL